MAGYRVALADPFGTQLFETEFEALDAGGGVDELTALFQRWSSNRDTLTARVEVPSVDPRAPYQLVLTRTEDW